MPTTKEMESMYKGTYRHMLTELRVMRTEKPGSYADIAEYLERVRKYILDVSGINELDPVPKD